MANKLKEQNRLLIVGLQKNLCSKITEPYEFLSFAGMIYRCFIGKFFISNPILLSRDITVPDWLKNERKFLRNYWII